jgi:BMFP domain-containing protein YqiC
MSKNKDFLTSLKSLSNNVHLGNKTATEIADSLNAWLKDGGEALKVKIEDEVERSVSKMGFVKRGEFEAMKQEVAALKKGKIDKVAKKTTAKKPPVKKVVKKTTKKAAHKKVAK